MNTNDNFDELWANLRASVVEAREAKPNRLRLEAKSSLPRIVGDTDIEVDIDSFCLLRPGSVMRCYLTKEDALQFAANIIAIHSQTPQP